MRMIKKKAMASERLMSLTEANFRQDWADVDEQFCLCVSELKTACENSCFFLLDLLPHLLRDFLCFHQHEISVHIVQTQLLQQRCGLHLLLWWLLLQLRFARDIIRIQMVKHEEELSRR